VTKVYCSFNIIYL